jgi:hypothetical protein
VNNARFRFSFISAECTVVPDVLMDLLLKLNVCYNQWPPRALIINTLSLTFEYLHPYISCPWPTQFCHCYSSVNFAGFYTL